MRRASKAKKQAPAAEEPSADVFFSMPDVSVEDKLDVNATVFVDAVCTADSSEETAACDDVAPGPSRQMGWHLLLLNALAAFQHLVIFCVSFTVSYVFWPYSSTSLMVLFLAGPIVLDLHSKWSRALDEALSKSIGEAPVTALKAWDQACI